MPFMEFVLFQFLLSIVFGRFAYLNKFKDYKKDLITKSNENIFPNETLHRSVELEYIIYQNEQHVNVKSKIYDMLHWMIPGMMLANWIKSPILTIINPDEQIIYLPTTIKGNIEDVDNQELESIVNKSIVSPSTQLFKQPATTINDLLNDEELKKKNGLELNTELEQNMNGTFEESNTTEVYEEPFIRIYVKPLCEGLICQNQFNSE